MKRDIRLYISNQEVLFKKPPQVLFTYQNKELRNPTVIKNSYTKTIQIEGTKENNRIFNEIYNLQRTQSENLYNPSLRAPFVLMDGCDIIERGYAKLDTVTRTGNEIKYSITLYGGLGDVFYNLAYGEDGEARKMSDLDYFVDGQKVDIDFNITKEIVKDAWDALDDNEHSHGMYDVINFAPCYNGTASLDGSKVLVSTRNTANIDSRYLVTYGSGSGNMKNISYLPTSTSNSGGAGAISGITDGTYRTFNGYALAELDEEITEWEAKDLRSYLQRPVLSVRKAIEAICNPVNNGGTEFVLDPDFFNDDNPYYNCWVTLPMLTSANIADTGEVHRQENLPIVATSVQDLGSAYGKRFVYEMELPSESIYTFTSASSDFSLGLSNSSHAPFIFTSAGWYKKTSTGLFTSDKSEGCVQQGIYVQLQGIDAAGDVVSATPVHNFTNKIAGGKYKGKYLKFLSTSHHSEISRDYGEVMHFGCFAESGDTEQYIWYDDDSSDNTFRLILNGEFARVRIVVECLTDEGNYFKTDYVSGKTRKEIWTKPELDVLYQPTGSADYREASDMRTGMHITKERILGGLVGSPCDFLLSYAKIFDLYFKKDRYEDKVYVYTRENWFDGKTINLDRKIDRASDMTVTPIAFSAKWYDYKYSEEERPENISKYVDEYGVVYGVKRVNTGYNFDSSAVDLLEASVFKNGISVLEQSKYYQFVRSNADEVYGLPTFLLGNGIKYNLYSVAGDGNISINMYKPTMYTSDAYSEVGKYYDAFDKLQLHSEDNEPLGGSGVLCFFAGMRTSATKPEEGSEFNPTIINYGLSDDLPEMMTLAGNYCWLYTNDEYAPTDKNDEGEKISIKISRLPHFTRMLGNGAERYDEETVKYSLDFGTPREVYVPKIKIAENADIYGRYWMDYSRDLYDVRTRVVDAMAVLDGMITDDALRHFYYFDGSIWVMNAVTDYNPAEYQKTKVQFIKVNDANAYSKHYQPPVIEGGATLTLNPSTVTGNTTVHAYVTADSATTWHLESCDERLVPDIRIGMNYTGSRMFNLQFSASATTPNNTSMPVVIRTAKGVRSAAVVTMVKDDFRFKINVISPQSFAYLPSSGGTAEIEILSDGDWTVAAENYAQFAISGTTSYGNPLSSSGNKRLSVRVNSNVGSDRVVNIRGNCGVITDSAGIKQYGAYAPITMSITGSTQPSTGGGGEIDVQCDGRWTIDNQNSWVTLSSTEGTGDTRLRFSVTEIEGTVPRNAVIRGLSGQYSDSVEIVQQPRTYLTLTADTEASGIGETITGIISSNAGWRIEIEYE